MSDRTARRQPLSRAEQLRQNRQQPSRAPVMPAKKDTPEQRKPVVNPFGRSADKPVQQPSKRAAVVTTRSYPYSTPLRQSVSTPARRKVYRVAANGVETRFPSLPVIRFSWQWVSGFMTVVLLTAVLLMILLPVFKVNRIQVVGNQRVALEEIQNVVLTNTGSIFLLDRQKVINAIGLYYPELHDIKMKVDLSGVVNLSVVERQPILAWNAGDFHFWVDSEGVLMTPRGDAGALLTVNSDCGIPVTKPVQVVASAVDYANLLLSLKETPLTPQDLINNLDPAVMKAAIDLSTQMPAGTLLVYDYVSGMGWQDPRGWQVYFGLSLEDIQFKLVEYQAIVDRLTALGIEPTTISVAHVDSPFFRTR